MKQLTYTNLVPAEDGNGFVDENGKIWKQLNSKQKKFCREYMKGQTATQAAIKAGYTKDRKGAKTQGSVLLNHNPVVRNYLIELEMALVRGYHSRGPSRQGGRTVHRPTRNTDRKDRYDVQGRHTHSTRGADQEASDRVKRDRGRVCTQKLIGTNCSTLSLYSTLLYSIASNCLSPIPCPDSFPRSFGPWLAVRDLLYSITLLHHSIARSIPRPFTLSLTQSLYSIGLLYRSVFRSVRPSLLRSFRPSVRRS